MVRIATLMSRLLLLGAMSTVVVMPVRAETVCPRDSINAKLELPHLRSVLSKGTEAVIVALGSSSTQGVMATDAAHTYPARLQTALEHAMPHIHVAVLNRGIGGQDAPEELARLQTDVIAVRPQLVIWQVGANGALRNADPAIFTQMVTTGVRQMRAAGIDVVLMDNQHSPKIDAAPEHKILDVALAQVAQATGAGLFSRAALMRAWAEQGEAEISFVSEDGLHHNNRGYTCVARALADDIVHAVHDTHALTASR